MEAGPGPANECVTLTVRVYSKAEKVSLTLNGKGFEAAKAEFPAPFVTEFTLPYAGGELKASATVNGRIVEQVFRTTGISSKIVLTADRARIRASRNDLSYVMAELQDDAVGSANPHDVASSRQPNRRTFHGRALAILRPAGGKGTITLEARGENLRLGTVTIDVSEPG